MGGNDETHAKQFLAFRYYGSYRDPGDPDSLRGLARCPIAGALCGLCAGLRNPDEILPVYDSGLHGAVLVLEGNAMQMTQEEARKLATETAEKLFTDGQGKRYQHLSIDNKPNLGWGDGPVRDIIQKAIITACAREAAGLGRLPCGHLRAEWAEELRPTAKSVLGYCSRCREMQVVVAALKAIQEGLASIVEDEDLDDGKLREHSESTLPNLCDIATKALSAYRATPPEGTPE
jgi:hypothetical protein